jgi:hypothetical protein
MAKNSFSVSYTRLHKAIALALPALCEIRTSMFKSMAKTTILI